MRLRVKQYLLYKFANSMFFGFSVGSVFVIYEPLMPYIYSLGGIILALGMLVVASQYKHLMNQKAFFLILLAVEAITLCIVLTFLTLGKSLLSAIIIYVCYQATFMFGGYVARIETIALKYTKAYSFADMVRQIGYLAGLSGAFLFYNMAQYSGFSDKTEQVYCLHYVLIVLQFAVIFCLARAFKITKSKNKVCEEK